jgi:hypothetical protein
MPLRCLHVVTTGVENRSNVGRSRSILRSRKSIAVFVTVPPSKYRNSCLLALVESEDRWEMNAYTSWNLIAMNNNKYK